MNFCSLLGRLDERFLRPPRPPRSGEGGAGGAHRAPSAASRRRLAPQALVGLILVGCVVLAAVGFGISALVGGDDSGGSAVAPRPDESHATKAPDLTNCAGSLSSGAAQPAVAAVVGPSDGTNIPSYIQARRGYLARCSVGAPEVDVVAFVSFAGSANPAGAAALVGRVSVLAAYVRLPSGPPLTLPVPKPVTIGANQTSSIDTAYGALADRFRDDATARPGSAAADAEQELALRQNCGCVYALAVFAPLRTLASLADNQAVRVVDAAPVGFGLDRISARPILPTETVTVDPTGAPRVFGS